MPLDYSWGPQPDGGDMWLFRLWAPGVERLKLRLEDHDIAMHPEADGWFCARAEAFAGEHYRFVLPDGSCVPDPASRHQPEGVHGPSCLCAPRNARRWPGRPWEDAVIYELHLGTFTARGSYAAAIPELARLAETGFTAIELMPVAQFGGDRGWGYDGVLPYAPHHAYGNPCDLVALVEAAHELGLMVLLDVVYNHFGPDGNVLGAYAPDFFDATRQTPWGAGIDYTRQPVRRFFIENALYWVAEFGVDGFRFDAIDQMHDSSEPELMVELAQAVRAAFPDRALHLTTEDNRNVTHLHERGRGLSVALHTAEWNDDMHNAAHVLATGEREDYYAPFADGPLAHLGRALAGGFSFQGEDGRGAPSEHLPPVAFVDFLQNHDQTGNRARGERLIALTDPATLKALTAILALSPHVPLFFMGEEYGETRPFLFFAHFGGDLDAAVRRGRQAEFAGFSGFESGVPDPVAPETFERSMLDPARRASAQGRAFTDRLRRLLTIRRDAIVPRLAATGGHCGRCLMARDGMLAVDWRLDGALLQLRANFADAPRDLPAASGTELHRTGPIGAPRSAVHWLLTE
jgi:malto-oligosyltrehalose trehalohydrolase